MTDTGVTPQVQPSPQPGQRADTTEKPQIAVLLGVVFLGFLAQMTLNPIIAPLAREADMPEWQVGVTISSAALMIVLTSQLWGRRSQSLGRKRVLAVAFSLALTTMTLFALLAQLGMTGVVTGSLLFAGFVVLRGIGFGTALAAVLPTAQAYIADVTDDQTARVKGMAGIGAAQGFAMVAGSVLGGGLSAFGLLAPLVVAPAMLLIALCLVLFVLRRESRTSLVETPKRVSFTDPRVWPFLLAGFGMFTALGFIQVITGFLVQDRLDLAAGRAGLVTGAALLAAGVGMVLAQALIVPRTGWSPPTLLRVGGLIALVGFAVLSPESGALPLFIGVGLIGLGLGIAMPGYTAGPSLLVDRTEQGGLAGLIGATNGLTFVVAPTLGTFLYGIWGPLPVIAGGAVMLVVTVFVFVHPRLRRVAGMRP